MLMSASEALRNQVTAKWQDSFDVLIAGNWGSLGSWSSARCAVRFRLFSRVRCVQKHAHVVFARPGRSLLHFYTREIWERHRRTSVSVCVISCVSVKHSSWLQIGMMVVDGESGESLVDYDEPIQSLQSAQVDDYTDPNWEPEPIDTGPG